MTTVTSDMRGPAIGPFRVRNFRLQWAADMLTSWAFEMEALVLGWFVLVETGSVVLLTLFGALIYLGTLPALVFGVIGDRIGYHVLLGAMRLFYATLAAILTCLAFAGVLSPVAVLVAAAFFGLVRPSDPGLRYALVSMTMPHGQFVGAMSLLRTTMDIARIAGALTGAALFVSLGMGPAYVAVAVLYAGGAALTLAIRPPPSARPLPDPAPEFVAPSTWSDLKEGLAYVWQTPVIRALIWIALLINLTAFPLTNGLMPYVAREIYHTDQTGLGYLVASFAVGALLGSLALTLLPPGNLGRTIIVTTLIWHGVLFVFAHMPNLPAACASLALAGFFQSMGAVALMVILLRTTSERLRGRVMGIRMMVIYTLPLGLLAAGALVGQIGFRATVGLYTATGILFTVVIAVRWREELWRKQAPANI